MKILLILTPFAAIAAVLVAVAVTHAYYTDEEQGAYE